MRPQQLRNTARYRRLRLRIFHNEPNCRLCKADGLIAPAEELDHIHPLHKGGDFWDESNLQPLCSKCHAKKSRAEMREVWARQRGPRWDDFNSAIQEIINGN